MKGLLFLPATWVCSSLRVASRSVSQHRAQPLRDRLGLLVRYHHPHRGGPYGPSQTEHGCLTSRGTVIS